MHGVLIINKPVGLTSHDVVARLRRVLKTKSIGHTGTLDPFATGVLVMLVGKATRLARFLDKDAKEYETVVIFGCATNTGDCTGEPKQISASAFQISDEKLEKALANFRGEIEQTPPMFSAKKIDGVRLYELARKGIEVERKSVKVSIYELQIIKPPEKSARQTANEKFGIWNLESVVKVSCSAGTYIRTLAEDIGAKFGVGAHLAKLQRTKAGKFDLSKAITIEQLETIVAENRLSDVLISMNEAVSHLSPIVLSEKQIEDTRNGKRLRVENYDFADGETLRMIDESENLIAVGLYNAEEKSIQPKLVLI